MRRADTTFNRLHFMLVYCTEGQYTIVIIVLSATAKKKGARRAKSRSPGLTRWREEVRKGSSEDPVSLDLKDE